MSRNKISSQSKQSIKNIKNYRCKFCNSKQITKWCRRKTSNGYKQRFKCKSCNKCFTRQDGFYRMKKSKQLITGCLNLYFPGMSLRKVREHIKQFTPQGVSHMSVWRWIMKFSKMIKRFTDNLKPTLSRTYHADEIFVNCKGNQHYFWDMVDKDTRFLVSTHYSTKRDSKSAKMLFLKAQHRPLTLFTDRLQGYNKAYKRAY